MTKEEINQDFIDTIISWACRYLASHRDYCSGDSITDAALGKAYEGCAGDPPKDFFDTIKTIIPMLNDRDIERVKVRNYWDDKIAEAIRVDVIEKEVAPCRE